MKNSWGKIAISGDFPFGKMPKIYTGQQPVSPTRDSNDWKLGQNAPCVLNIPEIAFIHGYVKALQRHFEVITDT
jgi:hypothetical protein